MTIWWRGGFRNFSNGGSFAVPLEKWVEVFTKYLEAGKIKQYESPCRDNEYEGRIYLYEQINTIHG